MSKQISLVSLLEIGAHRGNSRSKKNPVLQDYIYGYSNGLCIIDLVKTIASLQNVGEFMKRLGSKRKQILLVGTSKHLKDKVPIWSKQFNNTEMPYVNSRWLGGTLTNWGTVKKTLSTLAKYENIKENKEFYNKLPRNEQLILDSKIKKINNFFVGLKKLKNNRPGAVFVLDAISDPVAIREAESNRVPVITVSNTASKTLPKNSKGTIVANTNSTKTLDFIIDYLISSYNEGLTIEVQETPKSEDKSDKKGSNKK